MGPTNGSKSMLTAWMKAYLQHPVWILIWLNPVRDLPLISLAIQLQERNSKTQAKTVLVIFSFWDRWRQNLPATARKRHTAFGRPLEEGKVMSTPGKLPGSAAGCQHLMPSMGIGASGQPEYCTGSAGQGLSIHWDVVIQFEKRGMCGIKHCDSKWPWGVCHQSQS